MTLEEKLQEAKDRRQDLLDRPTPRFGPDLEELDAEIAKLEKQKDEE